MATDEEAQLVIFTALDVIEYVKTFATLSADRFSSVIRN
jgi:hypothetical protein